MRLRDVVASIGLCFDLCAVFAGSHHRLDHPAGRFFSRNNICALCAIITNNYV